MKVISVRVRNFAGLGDIDVDGLESRGEIVVGGRNGIGKSQLMMCIALAARSDVSLFEARKFIGPNSNTASVQVEFLLNEDERAILNTVLLASGSDSFIDCSTLTATVDISAASEPSQTWGTPNLPDVLTNLLNDPGAREQLPFTQVVYLPADRTVERTRDLSFSLSSLARERTFELGQQTLTAQLSDWNQTHTFDVFSSLAALHYAGLLENAGSKGTRLKDFYDISNAFERATGKKIEAPRMKSNGSIDMEVTIPGGYRHAINTLSSGELIALQLLHFVKLHYRQGSILLVDEPEQHLHPSLQVEIANAVRQGVGEGQLWLVTHSPNILQSTPGQDTLVLSRAPGGAQVEAHWADSPDKKLGLLSELGVAPGLWVPGNYILVVEGQSDEGYLRRLLPEETSGAFFVVAGNSSSVRSVANKLTATEILPHLAILDRDGQPLDVVVEWNSNKNRFMWSGYAVESLFLDAAWITATLRAAGDWDTSQDDVTAAMEHLVQQQREPARRVWVGKELLRRVPSRDKHTVGIEENLAEAKNVAVAREKFYSESGRELEALFCEAWEGDSLSMVDPKRILAGLQLGPFRRREELVNAMIAQFQREPRVEMQELRMLREKMVALNGNCVEVS